MLIPCPVCGHHSSEILNQVNVLDQHSAYLPDKLVIAEMMIELLKPIVKYETRKCVFCGLEYAIPFVAPGAAWYKKLYSNLNLFPFSRWEFEFVMEKILKDDVVVDYGCGSGQFLGMLSDKTRNIKGYDFSEDAVATARTSGINSAVLTDNIDYSSLRPKGGADHVTAFHVLEHLDKPEEIFNFAGSLCNIGGLLWVAVPSDRRASRLYKRTDHLDEPPHHLTRWTEKSLRLIGLNYGWEIIGFTYEPITIRVKLWEITRETRFYKKLLPLNRHLERLVRALAAIIIVPMKYKDFKKISGFSMLVCYRKK